MKLRTSGLLAACALCAALPESWSAAAASVKAAAVGGAGRPGTADLQLSAGLTHEKAVAKMHLRSVLASEVGIVHKTEYWGKVLVGTPQKEFTVIFDTGSGNLILPSTKCSSAACTSHEKFDAEKSTSAVRVGKKGENLEDHPEQKKEATIKFGTGKIHGQFYQDKLCLGNGACMTANFIGTDYESDMPFSSCSFDGIMGLGFKDLSMGQGFNMVDDIAAQHSLPSNKFSVFLTDDGGSEISFGGYKHSQVASEVIWAPVTRQSYWQIGIDDVTFDNKKTGLCSSCQVAVDTGTSLLAGPSDVVEKLGARLNLKDDCSNFHTLPLLGFSLGDKVLNLLPDDYIDRSSGSCSLALMTLDVPPPKGPLFIFGDPFLRRFLTIYDRDGPRVGFAVAKHADSEGLKHKLIATIGSSGGSQSETSSSQATEGHDASLATSAVTEESKSWSASDDLDKLDSYTKAFSAKATAESKPTSSALRGHSSFDADVDPLDAIDNENLSWGSIFKAMHHKKANTGMLQTTAADQVNEDQLVTITLARSSGRHKKK